MTGKVTLDDTLSVEINALAETYWRWAVQPDSSPLAWQYGSWPLKGLATAIDDLLTVLAPEGTDGLAFSAWVRECFTNNRPDMSMTRCLARALDSDARYEWDETFRAAENAAWDAARDVAQPAGWDKITAD